MEGGDFREAEPLDYEGFSTTCDSVARRFGFEQFDRDGTARFFEHGDGSILAIYRDGNWTHGDAKGAGATSLSEHLLSRYPNKA